MITIVNLTFLDIVWQELELVFFRFFFVKFNQ